MVLRVIHNERGTSSVAGRAGPPSSASRITVSVADGSSNTLVDLTEELGVSLPGLVVIGFTLWKSSRESSRDKQDSKVDSAYDWAGKASSVDASRGG
jgi:hypothetical protein